jgi:hypothetical protein
VPNQRSCPVALDSAVKPGIVLVGETAQVTLRATAPSGGECTTTVMQIVLVVDTSSATPEQMARLQESLRNFLVAVKLGQQPGLSVGLVTFAQKANALCRPTVSAGTMRACIAQMKPGRSGARLDLGLAAGHDSFNRAPRGERYPGLERALVVVSNWRNPDGCIAALDAADSARYDGVSLLAICNGDTCEPCVGRMPNYPAWFFRATNAQQLDLALESIARVLNTRLPTIEVGIDLPPDVTYIAYSARPFADWDGRRRRLVWRTIPLVTDPITVTYAVRPTMPGHLAVNVSAAISLTYAAGYPPEPPWPTDFPVTRLLALSPRLQPRP